MDLSVYWISLKTTKHQHNFEAGYNAVANELIHYDDAISIQCIFKGNHNTTFVNRLTLNDDDLHNLIQETQNNTQEPIIYQLSGNKGIHMWGNTLPIHRHIYDIVRMQRYDTDLYIKILSPDCELAGVKADCLAYTNITTLPHTSTAWGHIKKRDVPIIHECIKSTK